jgi:hypothetical protein
MAQPVLRQAAVSNDGETHFPGSAPYDMQQACDYKYTKHMAAACSHCIHRRWTRNSWVVELQTLLKHNMVSSPNQTQQKQRL